MEVQVMGGATITGAMNEAKNYPAWLMDLLIPHLKGNCLEAGIGNLQYTPQIAAHVTRLTALDFDPLCIKTLTTKLPDVSPLLGDLSDPTLSKRITTAPFDSIVCMNVLTSIQDDQTVLDNFYRLLKPGGDLLLLVPAFDALYGPLDVFANQFRRYTVPSLKEKIQKSGFKIKTIRYMNPIGGVGWWINAKFAKPVSISDSSVNRQVLLFDKYLVPLSRLLDPLFSSFFGQSVWAVLSK